MPADEPAGAQEHSSKDYKKLHDAMAAVALIGAAGAVVGSVLNAIGGVWQAVVKPSPSDSGSLNVPARSSDQPTTASKETKSDTDLDLTENPPGSDTSVGNKAKLLDYLAKQGYDVNRLYSESQALELLKFELFHRPRQLSATFTEQEKSNLKKAVSEVDGDIFRRTNYYFRPTIHQDDGTGMPDTRYKEILNEKIERLDKIIYMFEPLAIFEGLTPGSASAAGATTGGRKYSDPWVQRPR